MKCAKCDYELQGLESKGQCPECGFRIRRSAAIHRRNARPTSLYRDLGLIGSGFLFAIGNIVAIVLIYSENDPEHFAVNWQWIVFGPPAVALLAMLRMRYTGWRWSTLAVVLFAISMALLCYVNFKVAYWFGEGWAA